MLHVSPSWALGGSGEAEPGKAETLRGSQVVVQDDESEIKQITNSHWAPTPSRWG